MSDQKNSWFDKFFINELKAIAKNKTQAPSQPESSGNNSSLKDVNFYDYDGTLLHSYTVEEAQALTELPPLPTRKGLICQEWNYDLETIKAHNRKLDIGATYITDDGKTRLYITIEAEGRMEATVRFKQSVVGGVTVDWGDGSEPQTFNSTMVTTNHTYTNVGNYVITLDVADDCILTFGDGGYSSCIMGNYSGYVYVYRSILRRVEIGKGVTSINYAFQNCYNLTNVVIPNSITSIGTYAFAQNRSLRCVVIPNSATEIGENVFDSNYSLTKVIIPNSVKKISNYAFRNGRGLMGIVIPNGVTSMGYNALSYCDSLTSIIIPSGISKIEKATFYSCTSMKFYDFTSYTSIPSLENSNAFGNTSSSYDSIPSDCEIRVPAALYDQWIAATNWSALANNIVGG